MTWLVRGEDVLAAAEVAPEEVGDDGDGDEERNAHEGADDVHRDFLVQHDDRRREGRYRP